jgi:cysteinyl-tRNA synthetase
MAIQLFDSLERKLKTLAPSHPDGVFRFYNCGPTVYAPAHIGNFRTFVINDVIRRLLELEFGPDKVKHVRNITDVDDKTIRRSQEEKRLLGDFTKQWSDKFHADCAALNCLPPHVEPTATGHIREQIDMIAILERKGHAYRTADGSVYFKVGSMPNYGRLSRIKERELQPGSALSGKPQTADADEKEDGSDFALWKAHKPDDGDNAWDSPWGRGRPGWHIECSAMSKKHLGETIDLHTGGVDLLFPHHENEIAQSECCNGQLFSRHWYHSEHLLVDGKKMSKSLGNLYTLDDLKAKGFSPMALRYALLSGHPRKQLNFSLDSLHAAESALDKLRKIIRQFLSRGACSESEFGNFWRLSRFVDWSVFGTAYDALRDDLNVPAALGWLFEAANKFDFSGPETKYRYEIEVAALSRLLFALGLTSEPQKSVKVMVREGMSGAEIAQALGIDVPTVARIRELLGKRTEAKKNKDFATADKLRAELADVGWSVIDQKDGYSLEPAKK